MNNIRKTLASITLGALVLGVATFSMHSAEAYRGHQGERDYGHNRGAMHTKYTDMTDAQKAEMQSRMEQRIEWRKQDLKADVEAGRITQQEADARITLMQEHFKNFQEGKYVNYGSRSYSDMTDTQKSEFKAHHEQRVELAKKDLQAAVDSGRMSQKEADARMTLMQERYQNIINGKIDGFHSGSPRHGYNHDKDRDYGYHGKHRHNNDCPSDCVR